MDFITLAAQCAPAVAPETLSAIVTRESRQNPYAIGINGPYRLSRQPTDASEAAELAKRLIALGWSIDLGLAQINSTNLNKLGLTVDQAFQPCANLNASQTLLRECYGLAAKRHGLGQAALQAALSCYNTGDFTRGVANGYVASIYKLATPHK